MFTFPSADGIEIHVRQWLPAAAPPRAVVQIAHGMGEHGGRYEALAAELTALGYAVYANDHRGHGLSMHSRKGCLGADGWNRLVEDTARLSRLVRERHPGLPLVLLGHSLGSFAAQQHVLDHPGLADAVALCGTAAVDHLLPDLAVAGSGTALLGALNKAFQPARTPADWLTRDEATVDRYLADPLCGFSLDAAGLADLACEARRLADPREVPTRLPVYVFVGDQDPVNGGLVFSDVVVDRYRNAGLADVTYRIYPGARHELLNETNRAEVSADLTAWLDRVTG
ncbi:alpha/beta fold hydrolase [Kitasatospora sp. NPDC093806]|uniref:alpha/beta fold hydrolase n=1 Tax=Kitasatospora sp. NPDC093806 TaxID=3155075 RepID=UPI00341643AA